MRSLKILISLVFGMALLPLVCFSQSNLRPSQKIRSIFISENFPADYVRYNTGEFQRRLKGLLRRGGIQTPSIVSDADAELVVETSGIIVLHGTKDDPDRITYDCRLITPNRKTIWKMKLTFVQKSDQSEDDTFAAAEVATKLIFDWNRGKIKVNETKR